MTAAARPRALRSEAGDALCVRTGWVPYWYTLETAEDKDTYFHAQPGLSVGNRGVGVSQRDRVHRRGQYRR